MEELVWSLKDISFKTTGNYIKLDKRKFIKAIESFNELIWAEDVNDYYKSLIESGQKEFCKKSALYRYGEGIISEEMMRIDWDRMDSLVVSVYIDKLDVKILDIVFSLAEKMDCIVYDVIQEEILSKAILLNKLKEQKVLSLKSNLENKAKKNKMSFWKKLFNK